MSHEMATHAKEWDATFVEADVLGTVPDGSDDGDGGSLVVQWQFAAGPLAARERERGWGSVKYTATYP